MLRFMYVSKNSSDPSNIGFVEAKNAQDVLTILQRTGVTDVEVHALSAEMEQFVQIAGYQTTPLCMSGTPSADILQQFNANSPT